LPAAASAARAALERTTVTLAALPVASGVVALTRAVKDLPAILTLALPVTVHGPVGQLTVAAVPRPRLSARVPGVITGLFAVAPAVPPVASGLTTVQLHTDGLGSVLLSPSRASRVNVCSPRPRPG
jgi:hypothetical protein